MKIENQKISDCRVKLVISADAEETKDDYTKITKVYTARARIPGFRPGKAPLSVIQRTYGREMTADIKNALVARFSKDAIEQEKLDVVARVSVEDVVFAPETGISFVATLDVKPQFKLPKYQKLAVKLNEVKVDDAEVTKQIEGYRSSMSPHEDSTEPIAAGDMLQIDFTAKSGRKALADAVPGSERYAKAEKFWALASDEHEFIPGLFEAVQGKKTGDEFTFETKFPKDFAFEPLRGVKAKYTGTIGLTRRVKPIDDATLAKNVGLESVEKLREVITERMKADAQRAEDTRVANEISELLLKKSTFALPETMVAVFAERKLDEVIRSAVAQAGAKDAKEYAKEHADEIRKTAFAAAERDVRLNYILEGIAAEQKIEVTESEIQKEIDSAAQYYAMRGNDKSMTPARIRRNLEESGNMVLLKTDLLSSKVLKWIADDIKAAASAK